jgi:hypothetical protein
MVIVTSFKGFSVSPTNHFLKVILNVAEQGKILITQTEKQINQPVLII